MTLGFGEPPRATTHSTTTHYYWYKLIPRLTEHFTVVAPDLRGFGDTDRPPVEEGYDSRTNADDVAELMTQLGHSLALAADERLATLLREFMLGR